MHSVLVRSWLFGFLVATTAACGSSKPAPKASPLAEISVLPRHDYTSTWVYAVGEVEAPSEQDCQKAVAFVEAESNCVGAICRYGHDLARDFDFACVSRTRPELRGKMAKLRSQLASRAAQVPSECARQVGAWLERGCGQEGACEGQLQQWATQCSEGLKSPLSVHLLERLVENSLREPRRVKFDIRGCSEYETKLEAAAKCDKPFDCEDALPRVDEYLERCASGARKAVPLASAIRIVRVKLGAEKPIEPIALTETSSDPSAVPGLVALANGSGYVLDVCGTRVAALSEYLTQRSQCKDGSITLLHARDSNDGATLALDRAWHESELSFSLAHPNLVASGEAEARERKLIDAFAAFVGALPEEATRDFAGAFERVNLAYAALPPAARQSERVYQALAMHDSALVTMFSLIGEHKVRSAAKRLTDTELLGLAQRSEKLVFADVSAKGAVGVGKICEMSELLLQATLPQAFTAYRQKVGKLRQLVESRKIVAETDLGVVRQTLMSYTQACSAARAEVATAQKEIARCFASVDACSAEERVTAMNGLDTARSGWRAARVREILAKVALGQRETPSAVCNSW